MTAKALDSSKERNALLGHRAKLFFYQDVPGLKRISRIIIYTSDSVVRVRMI
ncbi:MAG: hypothetical protein P1P90_06555 [Patescibacteria group bacterium]|nr:hypothetical protein [Patescibacteria group bacterium]